MVDQFSVYGICFGSWVSKSTPFIEQHEGKPMRSPIMISRMMLSVPVLYLMLQVCLARHYHHSSSYHDDRDYFHSVSTCAEKHQCDGADGLLMPYFRLPSYRPLAGLALHHSSDIRARQACVVRSHSRAPPAICS